MDHCSSRPEIFMGNIQALEDEEMEYVKGIQEKQICKWEELLDNQNLGARLTLEGAIHSIRNMGDVALSLIHI